MDIGERKINKVQQNVNVIEEYHHEGEIRA
jgi:hypothetical protein